MDILLLGNSSTITNTLHSMLQSVDGWSVTSVVELYSLSNLQAQQSPHYDLIISNLEDFEASSVPLITTITNHFPGIPLLVIHSYSNENFINPMLNAGATGYIKSDISEHQLLEAVKQVVAGKQVLIADSTY